MNSLIPAFLLFAFAIASHMGIIGFVLEATTIQQVRMLYLSHKVISFEVSSYLLALGFVFLSFILKKHPHLSENET